MCEGSPTLVFFCTWRSWEKDFLLVPHTQPRFSDQVAIAKCTNSGKVALCRTYTLIQHTYIFYIPILSFWSTSADAYVKILISVQNSFSTTITFTINIRSLPLHRKSCLQVILWTRKTYTAKSALNVYHLTHPKRKKEGSEKGSASIPNVPQRTMRVRTMQNRRQLLSGNNFWVWRPPMQSSAPDNSLVAWNE